MRTRRARVKYEQGTFRNGSFVQWAGSEHKYPAQVIRSVNVGAPDEQVLVVFKHLDGPFKGREMCNPTWWPAAKLVNVQIDPARTYWREA